MCYQREKQIDRKKDRQNDIKIVCVMTYMTESENIARKIEKQNEDSVCFV